MKFLFLLIFLISCSDEKNTKKNINVSKTEPSTYFDEIADLISANKNSTSPKYDLIKSNPFYKNFDSNINSNWDKIENNYITKVKNWSEENLKDNYKKNTALYPLSGADFINLFHLSNDSDKYIMIGLETPGFVEDPNNFKPNEISNSLNLIKLTVAQIARQNYFSTNLMEYKFKNKIFPGVAPILMVFLKRLGFKIYDLERIKINEEGNLVKIGESEVQDTPEALQGIRIYFYSEKSPERVREIVFLKMFIQEYSTNLDRPEGKFFDKQNRFNIIMKSAIYLMHMEKFSGFLEKILSKTDRVVQDDSGIPLKYFSKTNWNIKTFGTYKSRIPIKYVLREAKMFKTEKGNLSSEQKNFTQDELIKIFDEQKNPLDFKYGYGAGAKRSNLILLQREKNNQ